MQRSISFWVRFCACKRSKDIVKTCILRRARAYVRLGETAGYIEHLTGIAYVAGVRLVGMLLETSKFNKHLLNPGKSFYRGC